jgi:beta-mannanase
MMRFLAVPVLAAAISFLWACGGQESSSLHPENELASSEPRVLAVYMGAQSANETTVAPWEPTEIEAFVQRVGTSPHAIMWYQNWAESDRNNFNPKDANGKGVMDEVVSRGAMPIVTWEPWDTTKGTEQPDYELKDIIDGKYDDYITQWAQDAAAWGKPMYLRFAHEMNGHSYPWSIGLNGSTSVDYVAAWKHLHDIFVSNGATNVRWIWSPLIACRGCTEFSEVYPGDDYVDWVALDGYNWGTEQNAGVWQTMGQIFGRSYDEVTALAPDKPFMIAETASAEVGGSKANWITNAFYEDIPTRLPKTKAIIWFDADKERDWRVNSSDASLEAYKKVAKDPSYQGWLP